MYLKYIKVHLILLFKLKVHCAFTKFADCMQIWYRVDNFT